MIAIGWLFYYYKKFYRKLFYLLFCIIRAIVLFINGKDINEILNLVEWKNARSVLFFYTNILVDKEKSKGKNYPVKKFKIKWYIWLIHYVWAAWVIIKIIVYMTIFYSFRYVKSDLWKHIWLVLLEYWRLRLGIFVWTLHIISLVMIAWNFGERIAKRIYKDKWIWFYMGLKYVRLLRYWKILSLKVLMYFWLNDKQWQSLGY